MMILYHPSQALPSSGDSPVVSGEQLLRLCRILFEALVYGTGRSPIPTTLSAKVYSDNNTYQKAGHRRCPIPSQANTHQRVRGSAIHTRASPRAQPWLTVSCAIFWRGILRLACIERQTRPRRTYMCVAQHQHHTLSCRGSRRDVKTFLMLKINRVHAHVCGCAHSIARPAPRIHPYS